MQPLKYPGGKHYLASLLHKLAAPHTIRLIPCAGGLGELWGWNPEGVSEIINDVDGRLTTFWRVLASPLLFPAFLRQVQCVPFAREVFEEAKLTLKKNEGEDVERAVAFFVSVRQSMMGLGKSWAPLSRKRLRRGMNEQASAWMTAVDGLPEAHERLRRVVVENLDILDFIPKYDHNDALMYLDPPYFLDTRTDGLYQHEMSDVHHEALLTLLLSVRARVMISGYDCPLYQEKLGGWDRYEITCRNNMTRGEEKPERVEVIWANYPLPKI